MTPTPKPPLFASSRSGTLHYLATIEDIDVWWDDGDGGMCYLTGETRSGLWTDKQASAIRNPKVAEFIRNHASL